MDDPIRRAAGAIAEADALLIAAGAGMGVDSGLPDFRGSHGFWRAYPPYEALQLDFVDLANPRWFRSDPHLAWGFYGHRRNLYRATEPHDGFAILRRWSEARPLGGFIFTSNVDAHFQRAGFDPEPIVEVHGSLEFAQCTASCGVGIIPADEAEVVIDDRTMRVAGPLPTCPACGALARPNVLMFGDWEWIPDRTAAQQGRFEHWLADLDGARLAIVECGAGRAVPTVRHTCESIARRLDASLIRINPREPEVPSSRHVSIAAGALETLCAIDAQLN